MLESWWYPILNTRHVAGRDSVKVDLTTAKSDTLQSLHQSSTLPQPWTRIGRAKVHSSSSKDRTKVELLTCPKVELKSKVPRASVELHDKHSRAYVELQSYVLVPRPTFYPSCNNAAPHRMLPHARMLPIDEARCYADGCPEPLRNKWSHVVCNHLPQTRCCPHGNDACLPATASCHLSTSSSTSSSPAFEQARRSMAAAV